MGFNPLFPLTLYFFSKLLLHFLWTNGPRKGRIPASMVDQGPLQVGELTLSRLCSWQGAQWLPAFPKPGRWPLWDCLLATLERGPAEDQFFPSGLGVWGSVFPVTWHVTRGATSSSRPYFLSYKMDGMTLSSFHFWNSALCERRIVLCSLIKISWTWVKPSFRRPLTTPPGSLGLHHQYSPRHITEAKYSWLLYSQLDLPVPLRKWKFWG
jgi:hypothetical protein